jgi:hypothetical protein
MPSLTSEGQQQQQQQHSDATLISYRAYIDLYAVGVGKVRDLDTSFSVNYSAMTCSTVSPGHVHFLQHDVLEEQFG